MTPRVTIRWIAFALALIHLTAAAGNLNAHDIPADAHVHLIVKPERNRLRVLVRAPLKSMLDVEFPTRGPGFLDIPHADEALHDAAGLWIASAIEVYEDDVRLGTPRIAAARASLESDTSFRSYDQAMALVAGPRMADDVDVPWNQTMLDTLLEYPIHSDRAAFSVHPKFGRLGLKVDTSLVFLPPDGGERAFMYTGDEGVIRLDPRWYHAAVRFVGAGFGHILGGADHLLFLLCLVIPIRRIRPLIVVVTAFTLGHSISLIAAAAGMTPAAMWFPALIETSIAVSILYMALENILGRDSQRRWLIAFGFGLIHGFGFSFALKNSLQFAGSHLLISLTSFNAGVELGQILALCALVPALRLACRLLRPERERMGVIVLSAFVAHTAWHWTVDRGTTLVQYQFAWPTLRAAELAEIALWLFVATLIAGTLWLASPWVARIAGTAGGEEPRLPASDRRLGGSRHS